MFTGIIKEIGIVKALMRKGSVTKLSVKAGETSRDASVGDSIAINGACLTVANISKDVLTFDIMAETLKATTLRYLKIRDMINLEPAVKANDMMSGHLVSGHIDEVGIVSAIRRVGNDGLTLTIEVSPKGQRFLVEKGSIAIDGISLTINGLKGRFPTVHIIPHTLMATTLNKKKIRDKINIEFDMMAKYATKQNNIDEDLLKRHGYI